MDYSLFMAAAPSMNRFNVLDGTGPPNSYIPLIDRLD
jgi:hypothetical protein